MTIGLKDLYYAVLDESDETYDTPAKMAEAMSADLAVTTAEATLYADDAMSEKVQKFVKGVLKLGIKELSATVLADLLGQATDDDEVVYAGKDDEPPYVAIGFRAAKTGGQYRYVWLYKVKFKVPGEKYTTRGESITFNTPEIEGDVFALDGTGLWKADIVTPETSTVAKSWFTKVRTVVSE